MKAVTLKDFGSADNFEVKDVPAPAINDNEVLIRVKAVSLNPVETMIRAGKAFTDNYKNAEHKILGWDVSGTVEQVGNTISKFKPGDDVFGMVKFPQPANAYAQYVAAPETDLAKKPSNISHEEAAGATLAALTAWQTLTRYTTIDQNTKMLIQAAAGGVGHYAVQMAKNMSAYVIGTASDKNRDFLKELGCDEHINYKELNFEEVVTDADFVLDAVGGENTYRSLDALKEGGTVVSLLAISTDIPEKAKEQGKNGYIHMVSPGAEDMEAIASLLESGKVKSHVYKTYSFEDMNEAHKQVESRTTKGKVIVTF